ncbi:MAG: response regulator [Snowella sp.]|nr:response regulator [Snowella sp.]
MSTALVVDDSVTDLEVIVSCLQKNGITVVTAHSGEEALSKLNNHIPDIIFLDVVMPGASGFEVCREIKNKVETSKIPVVICSTKGTEMDKFWGLKQGADAYLPKPVDPSDVVRTTKQLLLA